MRFAAALAFRRTGQATAERLQLGSAPDDDTGVSRNGRGPGNHGLPVYGATMLPIDLIPAALGLGFVAVWAISGAILVRERGKP